MHACGACQRGKQRRIDLEGVGNGNLEDQRGKGDVDVGVRGCGRWYGR